MTAYLGMQLGGVRSTSQVAKSFMGTGLKLDPEFWPPEANKPAILKLDVIKFDEVWPEFVAFWPSELVTGIEIDPEFAPEGGPGGLNPLLTALAIQFKLFYHFALKC